MFKLIEIFGYYTDLRKESMIRHSYARDKLLSEIEKRTGYKVKDLCSMNDAEIIKVLEKKKVDLKKIRLRNKLCAVYYNPRDHRIFYGRQAINIYQAIIGDLKDREIKGAVASAPVNKIKGKVSLVMDVHRDKFMPGNILVTTMTRPEFMPLMRKSKAVITDEGGIICHAAIVSRELNIPCIIGTRNATKALKDNDQIEMDLKTGVVRKI